MRFVIEKNASRNARFVNSSLRISRNAINTYFFPAFLLFNTDLHQPRKFTCAHARNTVSSAMDSLWIGGV